LRALGRMPEATQAFARAVALKPDYALAAANLARAQRDVGEFEQAEATARAALAQPTHGPPFRPLLVLLAGLLRERSQLDEAAQLYWRAIQAAPEESSGEWFNLGWVLSERGDPARAREAFTRSYAQDRHELRALLGRNLALPMVYDDAQAVEAARSTYRDGLDALDLSLPLAVEGLTSAQVIDGLRWTNFFLAYQGQDDRALQADYAALVARAIDAGAPQWHAPLTGRDIAGQRTRIGFASAFFHDGTVGRYFRSWITELERARFEVFVYHLWPGMDEVAEAIRLRADVFRTFGGSDARPSVVAPAIRDDALDVLVYPELGMDVTSFALAALRLAPRQLAAWGHPVTTGHPTIDGFLSCEVMELPDAQAQYTEKLLLLPGLGTSYRRPDVPADAARAAFGLPDDQVLLLCPQSLFKIHPDNDALLADLLAANPRAMLVFFAGRHPVITDQFMQRLQRCCAERGLAVRERTRVLPPLPHPDYLRVNLVCDAMVDTLHWSGGNTSLDALACGLPIVTLPGAHMRGRQSAGMLSLLGIPELIARDRADYLAIAARLVEDAGARRDLRSRIRARQGQLFNRTDAIERLQAIFWAEAERVR
jgi:protein O-GlcNAc transferase